MSVKIMAFVSRHEPTQDQVRLAEEQGWTLVHVGDVDAFNSEEVNNLLYRLWHDEGCRGIACVHPLLAITGFTYGFRVGFFRNEHRAAVGQPPQFLATALVVLRGLAEVWCGAPKGIED